MWGLEKRLTMTQCTLLWPYKEFHPLETILVKCIVFVLSSHSFIDWLLSFADQIWHENVYSGSVTQVHYTCSVCFSILLYSGCTISLGPHSLNFGLEVPLLINFSLEVPLLPSAFQEQVPGKGSTNFAGYDTSVFSFKILTNLAYFRPISCKKIVW